jgi:ABC-type uncharacterized transport system permease subunit
MQIRLKVDQVILGVGVILLGLGLDPFIVGLIPQGEGHPVSTIPRLNIIPSSVSNLSLIANQNLIVYLSLIAIPVTWFIIKRTFVGMKMTAVGENPRGSDVVGIHVFRVKFAGLLVSCILAGFAGSYLIYGLLGSWIIDITAGTGFVALAIVRIGNWNPIYVGLYALLIAGLRSFQFLGQIALGGVPAEFFLGMTYALSIIAIAIVNKRGRKLGPDALGTPYNRE